MVGREFSCSWGYLFCFKVYLILLLDYLVRVPDH
nr:MAG TPA: hypothetical protein [Caudoviricetes sp.]